MEELQKRMVLKSAISNRDLLDESQQSNVGGCEECFKETLNRIQSERMLQAREINLNLKNIKAQEELTKKVIDKNTKALLKRRNSQIFTSQNQNKDESSSFVSNKSFNIRENTYFQKKMTQLISQTNNSRSFINGQSLINTSQQLQNSRILTQKQTSITPKIVSVYNVQQNKQVYSQSNTHKNNSENVTSQKGQVLTQQQISLLDQNKSSNRRNQIQNTALYNSNVTNGSTKLTTIDTNSTFNKKNDKKGKTLKERPISCNSSKNQISTSRRNRENKKSFYSVIDLSKKAVKNNFNEKVAKALKYSAKQHYVSELPTLQDNFITPRQAFNNSESSQKLYDKLLDKLGYSSNFSNKTNNSNQDIIHVIDLQNQEKGMNFTNQFQLSKIQREYVDLNSEDSESEEPIQIIAGSCNPENEDILSEEDLRQNLDQYNIIIEEGEIREAELHTCSSDEQLKTGEVTLENPVNDENIYLQYNMNKVSVKYQKNNRFPNVFSQPFSNISNIRETEQEDDYSLEYI